MKTSNEECFWPDQQIIFRNAKDPEWRKRLIHAMLHGYPIDSTYSSPMFFCIVFSMSHDTFYELADQYEDIGAALKELNQRKERLYDQ